jgi:hypothetical protein
MGVAYQFIQFLSDRLGPALPLRQLNNLAVNVDVSECHRISNLGGQQRPMEPAVVLALAKGF